MNLEGTSALVTGANRGIGQALAQVLTARGAKVYAGVRDPATVTDPALTAIRLDVTDPTSVAAAAQQLPDVSIVINNAGVVGGTAGLLAADHLDGARHELEVNYLGLLTMSREFAPILAANGGGALVNILSVASFIASPTLGTYPASKAAAWAATNVLRTLLRGDGTLVVGAHFGYVDTDLTAGFDVPKLDPAHVAERIVAGLEAGEEEILVDPFTQGVKAALADDQTLLYPEVQRQYDAALAAATA
jgi:NAD(P)-dependent dehydrogenase (short-subunit alcohol dehydrogenase family)